MLRSGTFGLDATVLDRLSLSSSTDAIKAAMVTANQSFSKTEDRKKTLSMFSWENETASNSKTKFPTTAPLIAPTLNAAPVMIADSNDLRQIGASATPVPTPW